MCRIAIDCGSVIKAKQRETLMTIAQTIATFLTNHHVSANSTHAVG